MRYGFMDKILRVNLTSGTTTIETIPEQWARDYLGGAGLATKYLFEEVPADTDPLGPDNKLIFMTGPLTGTSSASASRYSVVSKSPLTGLWGHGNSGGSFGPAMKRAGFDGFIIEGCSEFPVYLEILDGEVKLLPANNLWGKTVPETEDILKETSDHKVTIASIGPGGENLVRYAAIMNNKHRTIGRTGMGAVMGSKKLKAIVCAGKAKLNIADPEGFKTTAKRQIDFLDESMLKVGFEAFGTNMVSDMVNARGGYPTRNWQTGVFDDIEEVNSEALTNKVLDKGVSCFACPIACGRGTTIKEGKYAGKTGEGPEYESANTLGALCGVSDMNAITMANYLCNENGLDTISTGSTIAFALECYEKGILTKEMTHGLELKFGNADLVIDLVSKRLPTRLNLDPTQDIQVLTPMKRGVLGTNNLNHRLQEVLNPQGTAVNRHGAVWRVGDKVMQTVNNYDKDVFNGDIGVVEAVDAAGEELLVRFERDTVSYDLRDLDELMHSYAISIHKSQGSEFPVVVIPIHTQHYMLLQRNLLYTGVTRGRRLVVLVGSRQAVKVAVDRVESQKRMTMLQGFLEHQGVD